MLPRRQEIRQMSSEDLTQCLIGIPSLVIRLEANYNGGDPNLIETLLMRTEEYCQLLRVLSGKTIFSRSM